MYDPSSQYGSGLVWIQPDRTFPHHRHLPTVAYQAIDYEPVATPVSAEFFGPEAWPRLGKTKVRASQVPMPEAAVYKHDLVPLGQH